MSPFRLCRSTHVLSLSFSTASQVCEFSVRVCYFSFEAIPSTIRNPRVGAQCMNVFRAMRPIVFIPFITACSFFWIGATPQIPNQRSALRFEISFPASVSNKPLDGHIMLGIAKDEKPEPRYQLKEEEAESAQFFGLDVDALAPGTPATISGATLGYPIVSLDQLPAGDYYVQAVLNIYDTFRRSDGHTIKLPPDMGEGQQWYEKPGNLMSKPQRIHFDPAQGGTIRIELAERIPAVEDVKDTNYVKHFRIQSRLLSEFWGRPIYLGAIVVLPEGFDEHPNTHYPLLIDQGHFPSDFR